MRSLVVVCVLAVLIVAILANEFAFQGRLFPSQTVGAIGGLGALAAVFALRAGDRYRSDWPQAVRHLAIWAVIVAIVAAAYLLRQTYSALQP